MNGFEFENEVRRIARQLWPNTGTQGAVYHQERETDAVFITDDVVHIIEATKQRTKKKAINDAVKIAHIANDYNSYDRFVKGWFITFDEPTIDQRKAINDIAKQKDIKIVAIPFNEFKKKIIDVKQYESCRINHNFGSAASKTKCGDNYIPLDMLDKHGSLYNLDKICAALYNGNDVVILGDYGAGKSTTMRELFYKLFDKYNIGESEYFPIALNLREHHGQVHPPEVLDRHARFIGYNKPYDLVRAWKSGYAILLLDGFDELKTIPWKEKNSSLTGARRAAMRIIQMFKREQPEFLGICVSGRSQYFDNVQRELIDILKLKHNTIVLDILDFSQDQIEAYINNFHSKINIPKWLPRRPLLLGTIIKSGIELNDNEDASVGWDYLLNEIAKREVEIFSSDIVDSGIVRMLLERCSTILRKYNDGYGQLNKSDLENVFESVTGYSIDDTGMTMLLRLPGLGPAPDNTNDRMMIDIDLAEAARAGDVLRYIENPFETNIPNIHTWVKGLSRLGIEICIHKINNNYMQGKLKAAINEAIKNNYITLSADLLLILNELDINYNNEIYIKDSIIDTIYLNEKKYNNSGILFHECLINKMVCNYDTSYIKHHYFPKFKYCIIKTVYGAVSKDDMPENFIDCEYDEFDVEIINTKTIRGLSLSTQEIVLLSILKKIYIQIGAGRQENALYRGLDHRQKRYVKDILALLKRHNFINKDKRGDRIIWIPNSSMTNRVYKIVQAPHLCNDIILEQAKDIK